MNKIIWNPSPDLINKMKKINEAKKTHTFEELTKKFKVGYAYLVTLNSWYERNITKTRKPLKKRSKKSISG